MHPFLAISMKQLLGLPPLASEHGEMVDHMIVILHWFMLLLFVGWSCFLIYVFTKYRKANNPHADYVGVRGHGSTHLEIGVIIVEVIFLLGFAFPLWAERSKDYPTGPNVLKMRALGEKFLWTFQYPGTDGVLGNIELKNITSSNSIGRDLKDPNGKDDFVQAGTMTLPVNRPVIVDVTSKDVIHNLALIPMRIAQDATPGVRAHIWFKPTKIGTWDIICGQLCGPGHAGMKATLEVVSEKDFDQFIKDGSAASLQAANPAPKSAAAPAPAAPAPAQPAK